MLVGCIFPFGSQLLDFTSLVCGHVFWVGVLVPLEHAPTNQHIFLLGQSVW